MKVWGRTLPRREALPIAAALLLPIPLFAQSGLSVPLPGVVERGLGSLVTVDATDEPFGTRATGNASEGVDSDRRSSRDSPTIGRGERLPTLLGEEPQAGSGSGGSPEPDSPVGEEGRTIAPPAGGDQEGGGDGGALGDPNPRSPGAPAAGGTASGSGTDSGSGDQTGVTITGQDQGATSGISAGTGGLSVDVEADDGEAGSDEPGSVGVEVTSEDGSSTGVGTALPGVGVPSP